MIGVPRILALLVIGAAMGCAQVGTYEATEVGPRAKLTFVSPYLEDRFLAFDALQLEVFEADAACNLETLGRISLSSPTYVAAGRRTYFSVWQGSTGMLGDEYARVDFSFVPKDGAEYRIEHIDNPGRIRVQFFEVGDDGAVRPLEVQGPGCTAP